MKPYTEKEDLDKVVIKDQNITNLYIDGKQYPALTHLTILEYEGLELLNTSWCTNVANLDIWGCISLRFLDAWWCPNVEFFKVSWCTSLQTLDFSRYRNLKSVHVSGYKNLKHLDVAKCADLRFLNVAQYEKLASLTGCKNLKCPFLKKELERVKLTGLFRSGNYNIQYTHSLKQPVITAIVVTIVLSGLFWGISEFFKRKMFISHLALRSIIALIR